MLHCDCYGQGPELVLLHGWGMHGGLLRQYAEQLGEHFHVTVVDLPGHGHSAWEPSVSLDEWAEQVLACAPRSAFWVGWSLGGLVALTAAQREPQRTQGLMLMASTPKFVTAPDWPCAVDAKILDQFAASLEADAAKTLGRFLSLQVRNAAHNGELLRQLRHALKQRPHAQTAALRTGLKLLQESDLREQLKLIRVPLCGLFGKHDTLVPAPVADLFGDDRRVVLDGAGHTPFLSHPESCVEMTRRWFVPQGGNDVS